MSDSWKVQEKARMQQNERDALLVLIAECLVILAQEASPDAGLRRGTLERITTRLAELDARP